MTRYRKRNVRPLAAQLIELGFAAPQVIAHRTARMMSMAASPSRRDRGELFLMGSEKIAAFYESWAAMWLELMRAAWTPWRSPASLFWLAFPPTRRSARSAAARARRITLGMMTQGMAPIHRRAVANAKRLNRTK